MGWEIDNKVEELQAENARLRAALNEIRGCPDWYTATKIACAALFPALEQSAHENPQVKTPSAFEHTPGTGSVR